MKQLLRMIFEDTDFQSILSGVQKGLDQQLIAGLTGSSRQMIMAALYDQLERPMLVMTHNLFSAQKIYEDLLESLGDEYVLLYPANELIATEMAVSSPELLAQRIDTLTRLASGFRGIVVTPFAGARRLLPDREAIQSAQFTLTTGEVAPMESIISKLVVLGYERVDQVEQAGEMSVRGGIIDLYPLTASEPYRIEWFDDEIDTIRTFSPIDQKSIERVETVFIPPSRECFASPEQSNRVADELSERLEQRLKKVADPTGRERLVQNIGYDQERLREHIHFPEVYKYISLFYPQQQTLLNYMPDDCLLIVDEPTRLLETARQLEKDDAEWIAQSLQESHILPDLTMYKQYDELMHGIPFQCIYISLFLRQIPNTSPQNIVNIICRAMQNFHGQMHVLKAEMERWRKNGEQVFMLANGEERIKHVRRVLEDYQIELPHFVNGNLQTGFEMPAAKLTVITEGEIFTQKQRKVVRKSTKKIENAERIKSYQELQIGDYVVHVNHGIGKYVGIGTLEINGTHKDYLHILYAGNDRLSVPIEQIDLVQKYIGSEENEPKIFKLGGNDWKKVKSRVKSSVADIADDLIKLYAARQEAKGFPFNKDTPDQQEFEALFTYEETPDQLRAIEEIKQDMERSNPMDRLLCGDVGYGKTEVAIRAAFKAAIEGKQVAVLVPTTILAQQHFETFRERFSDFPLHVEVLSRFRTRKEQTETIKRIKQGIVDVVIGTHRLLSADVQFKDLGLLIVDEEQRFGVSHKEKLKRLKTNVDVLTLTATPIPRTLHMSMLGVRDLSVIETPPENRFPVQTYVVEHNGTLVREAIERELARNGQVYYLFNRVQGIHQMAEQLQALVPEARVAVGHGQMSEQELEKTILDFLDGEFDVLVSTTIIETGVDIPNVNTLIVHDADKMGLSQLYQLRGRVGRSNRIAYAYFTYQRDKVLNEVAEKRLQAIKQFTELGSGFKIAMRDLTIRGAGNLLGAEQHGFIASVGFDLYSQMLATEIRKRKLEMEGKTPEDLEPIITQLTLQLDAYLPSEYIYDNVQKIEIYKRVAAVKSIDECEELQDELVDRFGDLPVEVVHLLTVSRLKVYGSLFGIESIIQKDKDLHVKFAEEASKEVDRKRLAELCHRFSGQIKFSPGNPIHLIFLGKNIELAQVVAQLEQFLVEYDGVFKLKEELQNASK